MIRLRLLSKSLKLLLPVVLLASAVMPQVAGPASAEETIPLVLSVPSLWENVLTPELLAEFEAQYSGVKVHLTFNETNFFGFGPGMTNTVDDRLNATEERVNSADVLYIDPTSLTTEDTQAGYFLDLAPLVMNDPAINPADFIPAVWQSYQWDNGFWALPLSTDVILVTYDPVAFDEAGLAYPNERWTIDDFANAARMLAQYDANGAVSTPGFSTVSGGNNQNIFLRVLAGTSLYDAATMPNAPLLSQPGLEAVLQTWYDLIAEGVVQAQGGGRNEDIPLTVTGINGYQQRGFGPDQEQDDTTRYAVLLPGSTAGLSVQGFAVSAGTQYPEQAYALARFLTTRSELANNMFSATPARYSLVGTSAQTNGSGDGPGGGPGGGPGFFFGNTIPEEMQPVVDQGLTVALPVSELRYASYLSTAISDMNSSGLDALSALQGVEAVALTDVQTAQARYGTVSLFVAPPAAEAVLAPGEIALNCAVNQGLGRGLAGPQLPNQDQWEQLVADFVASDPEVGIVNLESVQDSDLATLAESYDCIILSSNAVPTADLSLVLNLDPLIDSDPTFDRNDVIGNTLAQLQKDNKTWALPLAIQPQMLEYDQDQFAYAGVPEPLNGWTTDAFVDALHMLKPYDTDPAPFQANDPGGSYLLMLIAAFGGLPIDYRTDPATINYTDSTTVDAIRQVLDLAVDGYIGYSANTFDNPADNTDKPAMTTNFLNQFRRFLAPPGQEDAEQPSTAMATYPQGTQYNVIAYEITTGYISATAQNPEAAYRFLSAAAASPQLFSGMPARQSLVSDPAVVAAQGENIAAIYQQVDTLLRAPNTIVFPVLTGGGGANAVNYIQEYWLRRAFDRFVLEGADLELELSEAELITRAYMECVDSVVIEDIDVQDARREAAEQIFACAASADPTFSIGN